jgi:predicted HAD superfamily Cof-like phosphohydrolase
MSKTNAEDVKEFTEGYTNTKCPNKPVAMTKDEVFWLIRMVLSEMDELAATVTSNDEECTEFMQEALKTIDKCHNYEYDSDVELIGAQADAMVDAWYYMLNIAAKHGMNLSKLFGVIHEANMNKRDPKTKEFIRRESDGKVIKPVGWQPPNIDAEIQKQFEEGSWS